MVATADIQEGNGAGPTWTTITTARFATMDAYNPDTANPCLKDASMTYSYWKHHCLLLGGTFTTINNVRWFCDGTIGWGLGTTGRLAVGQRDAGDHGCPIANYDQATGTLGTTGDALKHATNGHTYYKDETAALANAETFVTGSRLLVDSGDHTVAEKTKCIVYQVEVDTDATTGTKTAETFTFAYDEV